MSSGLLSWAGKGISLLQLGFHKSFNLFSDWKCCHLLFFLPHQCYACLTPQ